MQIRQGHAVAFPWRAGRVRTIAASVNAERERLTSAVCRETKNEDSLGSRHAADVRPLRRTVRHHFIKEFAEGEKWSNRYAKYGACEVPLPVDLGVFANLQEAIQVAFSVVMPEQQVNRSFLPYFKDYFFVAAEPPPSC